MIIDKINESERILSYKGKGYFPAKFKFSDEINYEFDSFNTSYVDRYAHFVLYSGLSQEIVEIFEYSVVTKLYFEWEYIEFDVMIHYKDYIYFYKNEVLLKKIKKGSSMYFAII